MKVVIAGGNNEAEFIVGMFHNGKNQVVVINSSKNVVDKISKRKRLCVYHGDPWKKYCLEEADAFSADVFISLCPVDTDNFAACLMAKKCFNAQRTVCLVTNPTNVELYKEFGIDSVISSPYLLGRTIQEEASLENIMRSISRSSRRRFSLPITSAGKPLRRSTSRVIAPSRPSSARLRSSSRKAIRRSRRRIPSSSSASRWTRRRSWHSLAGRRIRKPPSARPSRRTPRPKRRLLAPAPLPKRQGQAPPVRKRSRAFKKNSKSDILVEFCKDYGNCVSQKNW